MAAIFNGDDDRWGIIKQGFKTKLREAFPGTT
jgi:hypothetical protein